MGEISLPDWRPVRVDCITQAETQGIYVMMMISDRVQVGGQVKE